MTTRKALIREAREWISVPAIESGTHKNGVNCSGLFIGIARNVEGLQKIAAEAEPYSGFKNPMEPGGLLRMLSSTNRLRAVTPPILRPGNFVLFYAGKEPQHLTIVTEPGVILHASQIKKKVVEHGIPGDWRVAREFEIVGIEE